MKRFFWMLLLFSTGLVSAQDFDLQGTHKQTVKLDDVTNIQIECYCPYREVIVTENASPVIELMIGARYSSSGFHGEQTIPTAIKPEQMAFQVVKSGTTLILSSKEWSALHHLFEISQLKISVPNDIKVNFNLLSYDDLEGRNSK